MQNTEYVTYMRTVHSVQVVYLRRCEQEYTYIKNMLETHNIPQNNECICLILRLSLKSRICLNLTSNPDFADKTTHQDVHISSDKTLVIIVFRFDVCSISRCVGRPRCEACRRRSGAGTAVAPPLASRCRGL